MAARRGLADPRALCSGPGKVGQALGISKALDGVMLNAPPFVLRPAADRPAVVIGPRIGITKAAEVPWRFGVAGSPFLSRRFAEPAG